MTRHILDLTSTRNARAKLVRFLGFERRERVNGQHRAIDMLWRLPRGGRSAGQVRSYLRQDRVTR